MISSPFGAFAFGAETDLPTIRVIIHETEQDWTIEIACQTAQWDLPPEQTADTSKGFLILCTNTTAMMGKGMTP